MLENVKIEYYRGDTYTRNFVIKGWNADIKKMYFTVKEKLDDKKAVLQKTLGNGIYLIEEDKENNIRTYNLTICCIDTDKLKSDYNYTFDIEIHSPGTNEMPIKKTIITGNLKVKASATKTCNEC